GIGFRLRSFTQEGTIGGFLKGYYNAALVASGPWILTVLTLIAIQFLMRQTAARTDLFLETIIYIYAFSLITTAPFQLVITRYLADQLDAQKLGAHIPSLVSITMVSTAFHAVVGLIFFSTVEVPWLYRFTAAALFAMVALVWLLMAFVGAVRAFHLVATAFVSGTIVSIVSAYGLGLRLGEPGYLMGMLIGNSIIVAICLTALAREFECAASFNFEWMDYFRETPYLPVAGMLYYAAIWSSIMIYWFTIGDPVQPHVLYAYEAIDLASFYAQMTIIPAVTMFYVHNETSFYEDYRGFYNAVLAKKSLDVIRDRRETLVKNLKEAFFNLGLVQAVVTFGAIAFAPQIATGLQMSEHEQQLFVNMALGAAPQVMLLFVMVIMFYFQFYKEAMFTSLIALVGSLGFGALTLWPTHHPDLYGFGLLGGTGIALVVGMFWLFDRLSLLDYITFSSQPLAEEVPFRQDMLTSRGGFGKTIVQNGKLLVKTEKSL
ncbi:MAG: exopolysaccharide Pel transporter PelG, partial [Candidatus Eremiobacteraeota bacterium]|nr:exopolysaccharide Pel transporter PelG [Candidatus Eremiobacteraeota bacterium]